MSPNSGNDEGSNANKTPKTPRTTHDTTPNINSMTGTAGPPRSCFIPGTYYWPDKLPGYKPPPLIESSLNRPPLPPWTKTEENQKQHGCPRFCTCSTCHVRKENGCAYLYSANRSEGGRLPEFNTDTNCGIDCPNICIYSCYCDTCQTKGINGYRPSPKQIREAEREAEEARLSTRAGRREQRLKERAERKAYEAYEASMRTRRQPTEAEREAEREADAMMREG